MPIILVFDIHDSNHIHGISPGEWSEENIKSMCRLFNGAFLDRQFFGDIGLDRDEK